MSEEQQHRSVLPQKKPSFKGLTVVLGVVALLVVGGKMYIDHAEKQRQEQVFVAEVGRMPHPRGMNKDKTDLHIAAELNLPVLATSLLDRGADIHAKGNEGGTPLHWAAAQEAAEVVEVLLKRGADVHVKDKNGFTPLHDAASGNAAEVVEVLLNRGGADIHVKDNEGKTPLHTAVENNAAEVVEVLLNRGADIHVKDNELGAGCGVRSPDNRIGEPTSTSKTTKAIRRCTMRRGHCMLLRQPRCC